MAIPVTVSLVCQELQISSNIDKEMRDHILAVLRLCQWDVSEASAALGGKDHEETQSTSTSRPNGADDNTSDNDDESTIHGYSDDETKSQMEDDDNTSDNEDGNDQQTDDDDNCNNEESVDGRISERTCGQWEHLKSPKDASEYRKLELVGTHVQESNLPERQSQNCNKPQLQGLGVGKNSNEDGNFEESTSLLSSFSLSSQDISDAIGDPRGCPMSPSLLSTGSEQSFVKLLSTLEISRERQGRRKSFENDIIRDENDAEGGSHSSWDFCAL